MGNIQSQPPQQQQQPQQEQQDQQRREQEQKDKEQRDQQEIQRNQEAMKIIAQRMQTTAQPIVEQTQIAFSEEEKKEIRIKALDSLKSKFGANKDFSVDQIVNEEELIARKMYPDRSNAYTPVGAGYNSPASINFLRGNTMWCADGELCKLPPNKTFYWPIQNSSSDNPTPIQWLQKGPGMYYEYKNKDFSQSDIMCNDTSSTAFLKTLVPPVGPISQYFYIGGCIRTRESIKDSDSWSPWKKVVQN